MVFDCLNDESCFAPMTWKRGHFVEVSVQYFHQQLIRIGQTVEVLKHVWGSWGRRVWLVQPWILKHKPAVEVEIFFLVYVCMSLVCIFLGLA